MIKEVVSQKKAEVKVLIQNLFPGVFPVQPQIVTLPILMIYD